MAERWLLTGGTGQVGLALRRNPPPGVEIDAPGRDALDLAQPLALDLSDYAAVINCGAYTGVDQAESQPALAARINAGAPHDLAVAAAAASIPIVHVSTDYVFSPTGTGPWHEDSPTSPGNTYGTTKRDGEDAIKASRARHAIVRTAWVVSSDGSNFVKTMLRLGTERNSLRVVADQSGSPTHAGDLAAALATITTRFVADPAQPSGIWHCANDGETTWHGLAEHVFAVAARHGLKVPDRLEAITTADYPTPARRPADSRLYCGKLAKDFGISLRPWQEAVEEIVAQLAHEGQAA
jgi:dTDP-4-dehydrorhamnose reductase